MWYLDPTGSADSSFACSTLFCSRVQPNRIRGKCCSSRKRATALLFSPRTSRGANRCSRSPPTAALSRVHESRSSRAQRNFSTRENHHVDCFQKDRGQTMVSIILETFNNILINNQPRERERERERERNKKLLSLFFILLLLSSSFLTFPLVCMDTP